MRLADMHIHTTFSPDGKSSMEEQCIKAIEIGIPIICFTDGLLAQYVQKAGRLPLGYPNGLLAKIEHDFFLWQY